MIRHYLISTLRQLYKSPKFYLLNIFGLAIGISVFLIIYQYGSFQLSFDKYHPDASRIHRLNFVYTPEEGQEPYVGAAIFSGVGPAMVNDFPQVEQATRLGESYGGAILRYEDEYFKQEQIFYAEPSLFDMFRIDLRVGNPRTALSEKNTAVISEKVKLKLFGDQEAVGKTVEWRNTAGTRTVLITGVFKKSLNSHLKGEIYLSWLSQRLLLNHDLEANWRWFDYVTYIKLAEGTDPKLLEAQIPEFIDRYRGDGRGSKVVDFDLVKLTDIHLHSNVNQELGENGDFQAVLILILISGVVLLIAWVNYINLYTAKAVQRGKEVGIRKTLGSSKTELRWQFFVEALFINLCAVLLAIVLIVLFSPGIGNLTETNFPVSFLTTTEFWIIVITIWVASTFFSGVYPALLISKFDILEALKSVSQKNSGRIRRIIVSWQFLASATLMTFSTMVYHQIEAMNNRPIGINTNEILAINAPNFTGSDAVYINKIQSLKTQLTGISGVERVALSSDVPGMQIGWRGSSSLLGENSEDPENALVFKATVGNDFTTLYGMEFLAGRGYERDSDSLSVIINESALALYGFSEAEKALNRKIVFLGIDTLSVLGVVANYHQESLKEPFKPTAFIKISREIDMLSVKIQSSEISRIVPKIEEMFSNTFPGVPFQWGLVEDKLENRHQNESSFLKTFNIFVGLSILISVFGLLGLVSFTIQSRLKEIGIRKVLGSSILSMVKLLVFDFAKLVIIGNLIALPIAYYLTDQWLAQFSFRISYLWWTPVLVLIICLILAFVSSVFHVLKAARFNPIDVLQTE
ncbi:hypothetical protein BFP97_05165 [Roseivirga sp. 4D4]|uniref:FtsX-like permease family protein n=1 Tax=Roseivirga sp. 4D4 TaxID=1889784 RepID=UPI00085293E6|nr:FtsX-like permease family protein [Roseivirga sp. 4D4]OEK00934.1 hypothetical protein BFP97_05165 [Roseivirga sp. 4D4]